MLNFLFGRRKPLTIIQVGAYLSDDRLIETCRKRGHRLYLFEPNPRRALELQRKTAGAPTIQVMPMAVSNYNGKASFNIAVHDDCSSLQEFDAGANAAWVHAWHPYKNFEMVERIEVDVIRLDTFMEREGIAEADRIEIDAQGEDLRVAESLGSRIADVGKIQIEVNIHGAPLYCNSFGMREAVEFFEARHFEKHVSWKQCLNREENVIFRNRDWYRNPLVNKISAFIEQYSRSLYHAALKLPRVLAVTKMMLGRKLKEAFGQ